MQLGGTKDLLIEKLETMAKSVAEREGCLLYDVEISGSGGGRIVRIYIDKEVEGGVSVEDCANVSRGMNLLLDVEDLFSSSYHLEVSSPGLERPLKQFWHFGRAVGQEVWIKTSKSMESIGITIPKIKSAKQLTAKLKAVEPDNKIIFNFEEQDVIIPAEIIEKAKVVYDFGDEKIKPGQKPGANLGAKNGNKKTVKPAGKGLHSKKKKK